MKSVRGFIAVECPEPIKEDIRKMQEEIKQRLSPPPDFGAAGASRSRIRGDRGFSRAGKGPAAITWVRPAGFHLTLKFLGGVPEETVPKIIEALRRAVASFPPFAVKVGGVGLFPNRAVPRILWVGVQSAGEVLTGLQGAVEKSLEPLGFAPERRAFHPHLTLARIKPAGPRALEGIRTVLLQWLDQNRDRSLGEFEVREVLFMQSDLQPGGAVYTRLAAMELVAA